MLQAKLLGMFTRYYFAVLNGDIDTVKDVLAEGLLQRFRDHAVKARPASNLDDFLRTFLARQKSKIDKIPYQAHDKHCLSALAVTQCDGGLCLLVGLGETEVSKPIYFAREKGEYKLAIRNPLASSEYRVKNNHFETHRVRCKGGSENTVGGGDDHGVNITCDDDCGNIFSGTTFEDIDTGRKVTCDYNTVGWDARFNEAGVLECHDNC